MDVPYFDLKEQYRQIREEILAAVERVCRNSSFALGEEVARFEEEFAAFCGVKHCVAVNSGTSALHLALLAVGAGPGDEVITTPNTFTATAEAISYTGATPVFADIEPATGNISPEAVDNALSDRTRVILPVHLYGRPARLCPMLEIAGRRRIALVEDACQAHGARYAGARVGGFGQASAFSFYPGKNLGAYGEGGALTTSDDRIARLARALRNHGEDVRYRHDRIGYNYRMDGFQGAVLRVKLGHLERWTARRRQIARLYREQLQGARVEMPQDDPQAESVYHLFVVWVDNRDAVQAALQREGVQTAVHYPLPLHLQKAYEPLGHRRGSFPNAERACDRALTLPLFPEMTDEQVRYAAAALTRIVGTR